MSVRDTDRGARDLRDRLEQLARGVRVTVGVHEDDGARAHPSGGTVADVAVGLELGSEHRPPAAFVRTAVDERQASIATTLAGAGERVLRGEAPDAAFAPIAAELEAAARARCPVDTGTTRDAITARVEVG